MLFSVLAPVGAVIAHLLAFEHNGHILLVTLWSENPDAGVKRPDWVIPLETLEHQTLDGTDSPANYMVNEPIDERLFQHETSEAIMLQNGAVRAPHGVTFPLANELN